MPCRVIKDGDFTAIVCSRASNGKCKYCFSGATQLCDEVIGGPDSQRTCDVPMCRRCSYEVGDKDYCRPHSKNHLGEGGQKKPEPAEEAIWIKAKFAGKCGECDEEVSVGDPVLWFRNLREVHCKTCGNAKTEKTSSKV